MIKQFIKLNLAFMLTLTAGCGTDSAGKAEKQEFIPKTKAFKDDFTSEFIKSPDETEDGYYTFVSKTKGYTMLFPVNATRLCLLQFVLLNNLICWLLTKSATSYLTY